ncbi:tRNA lysidine(34) synthetase TilS [Pseudonocardia sp. CA-107938]|uniref:tRNA lysidine(34) synthetase TilS n=1 Tax=Pseudonocardia sp. CA-107938 TaxID=3240021 RepID=UPI003D8CF2C2
MSLRAVTRAVRDALGTLPPTVRAAPPLVACSGGADSVALAAAVRAVRNDARAAVVDHGLQDGSAAQAAATVERLAGLGVPAEVHAVRVEGSGGLEAAARRARYAALESARPHPDSPVLLGHTLDDQAETVLLGLGRGSGARSLAGMRVWQEPWLRPLLRLRRADTVAACAELGVEPWSDPHNSDPRFTRVRLRHEVLPLLEDVLAGGVAEALARTADQLREDTDLLDALAADLLATARAGDGLDCAVLAAAAPALRRRALRTWLGERGVTRLTAEHLLAADRLVTRQRDASGVALPGGCELHRAHGRLHVLPIGWPAGGPTAPRPRRDSPRVRR